MNAPPPHFTHQAVEREQWTLADWQAEGLALTQAARLAGRPGMAPHHDDRVARAYALIAAPRSVTKGVVSQSGDRA